MCDKDPRVFWSAPRHGFLLTKTHVGSGNEIGKTRMTDISQDRLIATGAYPGFCSMKRLEVFLLPLDGMLSIAGHFPAIC